MRKTVVILQSVTVSLIVLGLSVIAGAAALEDGINDLAEQISGKIQKDSIPRGSKLKIAVMELSDINGNVNDAGRLLAEELIMPLFLTKKFIVIERNLLNKVLKEHSLQLTGIIDENTVKKLGKILGVDAVCSGTMTQVGDRYKINLRLISTETGAIIAAASSKIPASELSSLNTNQTKRDSTNTYRTKSKGGAMPIEPGVYRVMVRVLNMRQDPSTTAAIIEGLVSGDKVDVIEITGVSQSIENIEARWVRVRTRSGKEGYVFSGFLLHD